MSRKVGEIYAELGLDNDKFNRGIDASHKRGSSFLGSFGAMAAKAGLIAGAALTGVAVVSGKAAVDFETGMREVFTLLPQLSGEARTKMEADVLAFSKSAGVVPSEVIPALYQAISAGVPQDTVFDFLSTASEAAIGGVTDLETAVDGITGVVNAYGAENVSASQAADLMFTAVKGGKTTFEELSSSLFQVIPTAAAAGVEFGDVTAALARMTAQNIPTRVATTQLRQMLVELGKDGTKASDAFKELSGRSFQEFIDEGGNVADALDVMTQAAEDNGVGLADMFGSVEAGQAALALAANGTDDFREALDESARSAGASTAAFEEMDAGTGRSFERIKASIGAVIVQIGQKLLPMISKAAEWVVAHWPQIEEAFASAWRLIEAGVQWLWQNALQPLIENVLMPVVAWVVEHWPEISAAIGSVFDKVAQAAQWLWNEVITPLWENVVKPAVQWIVDNWGSISGTIGVVWDTITTATKALMDNVLMPLWEEVFKPILAWVEENWPTIQTVFETVLEAIQRAFEIAGPIIKGLIEAITTVIGFLISALQTVIGLIDTFLSQFGKIDKLNIGKLSDFDKLGTSATPQGGPRDPSRHSGGGVPGVGGVPLGTPRRVLVRSGETVGAIGGGMGQGTGGVGPITLLATVYLDSEEVGEIVLESGVDSMRLIEGRR